VPKVLQQFIEELAKVLRRRDIAGGLGVMSKPRRGLLTNKLKHHDSSHPDEHRPSSLISLDYQNPDGDCCDQIRLDYQSQMSKNALSHLMIGAITAQARGRNVLFRTLFQSTKYALYISHPTHGMPGADRTWQCSPFSKENGRVNP
jgi:hypothetical protein